MGGYRSWFVCGEPWEDQSVRNILTLFWTTYLYAILANTKLTSSHDFLGEYTPKQTNPQIEWVTRVLNKILPATLFLYL